MGLSADLRVKLVAGQKVRHFCGRAVDRVRPLRQDLGEYRAADGSAERPFFSRGATENPGVGTTSRTGAGLSISETGEQLGTRRT